MTFESRNTSRQCGGVGIVWIKKVWKSLYSSIVLRMTASAIIAMIVVLALMVASSQYSVSKNRGYWQDNITEIQRMTSPV